MVSAKTIDAGNLFFRRFFIKLLLGISVAAFLLRLGVAFEFSAINGGVNNMLAPPQVSDLHTYIKLGQEIAQGIFPKPSVFFP